jgi:hypothetical protein
MAEATAGALQIVQTQQNLVGRTVVGGASAVTGESSDKVTSWYFRTNKRYNIKII